MATKVKQRTRDELNNYYYNGNDLMSYNASISFIMGERASGKSFFFKRKLLDDFLKYGRYRCSNNYLVRPLSFVLL